MCHWGHEVGNTRGRGKRKPNGVQKDKAGGGLRVHENWTKRGVHPVGKGQKWLE